MRIRFGNNQIRLLAFWDKTDDKKTLVLATHGFIKKVDKVPAKEIERAINIRTKYFDSKRCLNFGSVRFSAIDIKSRVICKVIVSDLAL